LRWLRSGTDHQHRRSGEDDATLAVAWRDQGLGDGRVPDDRRLALRAFTVDDLDALEALDADPEVMRYINGGHPTSREELREGILPFWLSYYELGDSWGFLGVLGRDRARDRVLPRMVPSALWTARSAR
jgi:hypothetical protein